ncbi:hypothetical protein ASC61_16190 [Aeromicrobium sp. Root344]|uniref:hypothetical protein n=1 Tax=Aeromicrobium sp. Root344 TaxID=1736521 RepID=UPI0006F5613B|nr:hypothetical protein [Aeromicrobium sp. Root344]KQV76419.1 hypothetical protein ASC61_16190 [Aeromicrobium sp. Root344]
MRRVLRAAVTAAAVAAVSFGVGWVASGADDRPGVSRPASVAHLRPLPVPRLVIPNGPWADPHPPLPAPVAVPSIGRGLVGELFRALGLDLDTGAFVVRGPLSELLAD